MTPSKIKVENASVTYKVAEQGKFGSTGKADFHSIHALKNISFELTSGDRLGIIGKNGSGKSTLLKMLAGAIPPTNGRISSQGEMLVLLNRRSGTMGKAMLEENALLKAYSLQLVGDEASSFVENCLKEAGMQGRRKDPLNSLSAGMSGRFNLALNSQIVKPIVIVDEWIGALDNYQSKSGGVLNRIQLESQILVIATHDEKLLRKLCNKVILLNDGEVDYFGLDFDKAFNLMDSVSNEPLALAGDSIDNEAKDIFRLRVMNLGRTSMPYLSSQLPIEVQNGLGVKFHGLNHRIKWLNQSWRVLIVYRDPIRRFISAFNERKRQIMLSSKNASADEVALFDRYKTVNDLAEALGFEEKESQYQASRAMMVLRLVRQDLSWYFAGVDLSAISDCSNNWLFCNFDDRQRLSRIMKVELGLSRREDYTDPDEFDLTNIELTSCAKSNLVAWFSKDFEIISHLDKLHQ